MGQKDQEKQERQEHNPHRDPQAKGDKEFPKPEFNSFVTGLYTQTLLAMGVVENPRSGEKQINLNEAQFLIDTIGMLEVKTSGNLSEQEAAYLKDVLGDLRMRYVNAARKDAGGAGEQSGAEKEHADGEQK